VEPHDDNQLLDALRRLIGDPAHRSEMALRAARRAEQFTAGRMAGEYLKLYRELCGSFSSTTL
jgi:glycosyltransferase involved in cell wall biosynthesis